MATLMSNRTEFGIAALTGKYIVIGKKTAGGWKIHHDIWNFDA